MPDLPPSSFELPGQALLGSGMPSRRTWILLLYGSMRERSAGGLAKIRRDA